VIANRTAAAAPWLALLALAGIGPVVPLADALTSGPAPGRIGGRVRVGGKPLAGWRVLIGRSGNALRRDFVASATTTTNGDFETRVTPGSYVIAAERPSGRLCGLKRVKIRLVSERTFVEIDCAK
jgi:hypothetical protein